MKNIERKLLIRRNELEQTLEYLLGLPEDQRNMEEIQFIKDDIKMINEDLKEVVETDTNEV